MMPRRSSLLLFLLLLVPAAIVLLAGLALAWRTGQADPWVWAVPALLVMAPAGWWLARWGWPASIWAGLGLAGIILIFCAVAAMRASDPWAAVGLVLVVLLATGGGAMTRRHIIGGAAALLAAALLCWLGPPGPVSVRPDRPRLAILSALPLFWQEGAADPDGRVDAPIITLLRTRFDLRPIDDPRQLAASGARVLLLAQPRTMPPAALVALDAWVRRGGRLLLLTDRDLRWPSTLPLGDRRRPPMVATLDGLLAHWGVETRPFADGERRHFLPDGSLLTLSGATMPVGRDRDTDAAGPLLDVRVGQGDVLLLGDADILDDRLWLADPARPLDMRAWSADTPALVARWLGADLPGGRRWFRQLGDVHLGLRSAFLVGTGWAILGLILLGQRSARNGMRTNHENKLAKGVKNG